MNFEDDNLQLYIVQLFGRKFKGIQTSQHQQSVHFRPDLQSGAILFSCSGHTTRTLGVKVGSQMTIATESLMTIATEQAHQRQPYEGSLHILRTFS